MATNFNEACCTIPAVESNYVSQGAYEEIAGFKSYVVGDKGSKSAIIGIYDVYGFHPHTEQGADILASLGNYVIIPDYLRGKPWPVEKKFPLATDEEKKEFGEWWSTIGSIPERIPETEALVAALAKDGKSVGIYGLCWGGKIATLVGGSSSAPEYIKAVSSIHAGLIDPKDAEVLKVPIALFPSKDEDKDAAEAQWKVVESKPIASKSVYRRYDNMHHGWAGSRANLEDPENVKEFGDLYSRLGAFFKANL